MFVVLLVILGLYLFGVAYIWKEHALPEIVGVFFLAIFVLTVVSAWEPCAHDLRAFIGKGWRPSQPWVRILCFGTFFPVFSIYFLTVGEVTSVPATLELGVIAVAATLGGLVLNAGLGLDGEKRREFILVAQKFIVVIILMIIFLPTVHFAGLAGDINVNSFEPGDLTAWGRGVTFWVGAASFFAGTGLFVVALVDLAYAVFGFGGTGHKSHRN